MNGKRMTTDKERIPVFFAVDDGYAPYFAVALRSLIENASPAYCYEIYVLIDVLSDVHRERILAMQTDGVRITFVNVAAKMEKLQGKIHLRDYYTKATYYRFFIPEMFPEYDRGIYLDCDIAVTGDISLLYRARLGSDLLGAAPEEVMAKEDVFGRYVEHVLHIPREEYFSAGILVLNLREMRKERIEEALLRVMSVRKFPVTQDQDYLNVICHGRVTLLSTDWNRTAFPDAPARRTTRIVHYKINWKPWHYTGTRFEEVFWQYAAMTPYENELHDELRTYSEECRREDTAQLTRLRALAESEIALSDDEPFVCPACLCSSYT